MTTKFGKLVKKAGDLDVSVLASNQPYPAPSTPGSEAGELRSGIERILNGNEDGFEIRAALGRLLDRSAFTRRDAHALARILGGTVVRGRAK
jgi:hypothetical protein